jgi:hypothetical protein
MHFDKVARPISRGKARITKLVVNDGQTVSPSQDDDHREGRLSRNERNNGQFEVDFDLSGVPAGTWRVKRLTAYVEVQCGSKATRQALISPLDQAEHRAIHIKGFDKQLQLKLRRRQEHGRSYFRVSGGKAAINRIKRVKFYDRHGDALEIDDSGHGRDDGRAYLRFRGRLEDKTQLVLSFFKSLRTIRVPIELTSLPLTDQPQGSGEPLAVRLQKPDALEIGPVRIMNGGGGGEASQTQQTIQKPKLSGGDPLDVQIKPQNGDAN